VDRVKYFPSSAEAVYLQTPATRTRLDEAGIPPGFRVLFAGNIGAAQGLDVLLDAAERLRHRRDIQWVVVGDGSRRQWFDDEVARRGLGACVHRVGRFPVTEMPAFFASADVLLVTLNRTPGLEVTIPSKVQSYLAAGRPIVASLDGEGARVIREAGAGVTAGAGDAAALAAGVARLADLSPEERAAMGRAGRRYYDAHFDETRLMDQLEAWCRELARARPGVSR
jgi:glycosyltransferase involved in cell wall biosynthesis